MLKNKGFIFTFRRNIIYVKITLMVIRHNILGEGKMEEKREFVYFMRSRLSDGTIHQYPIYRKGEDYYIEDHKVPSGKDIEEEINRVFGATAIEPVMPHPLHEETKFKNP